MLRGSLNYGLMMLLLVALSASGLPGCDAAANQAPETPPAATPHAIEAALEYAKCLQASGNWEVVLRHAQRALDLDPGHVAARIEAGNALFQARDYRGARAQWSQLTGSSEVECLAWQGHAAALDGQFDQAKALYERSCEERYPVWWAPVTYPTNRFQAESCIVYWKRVAQKNESNVVVQWLLGNAYAGANRYEEATEAYARALAIQPDWPPAVVSMAVALQNAGKAEQAAAFEEKLRALGPTHMGSLYARLVLASQNPSALSAAWADFIRGVGPRSQMEDLIAAAQVSWEAHSFNQAINCLNEIVLRSGEFNKCYLGAQNPEDVLEQFRGKLPLTDPVSRYVFAAGLLGTIESRMNFGNMLDLMASGERARWLADFNTPSEEDAATFAGQARRKLQEIEASYDSSNPLPLEALANFDPSAIAYHSLASVMLPHLGRCVRELESALAERPDFHAAKVMLAHVWHFGGQQVRARDLLREVLEARPDATMVRIQLSRWVPGDEAVDLMSRVHAADADHKLVQVRNAYLAHQLDDPERCIDLTLAVTRRYGAYWDMFELLGISLDQIGKYEAALACLEYSGATNSSPLGAISLAKLRARLGQSGVAEALIDAWRIAAIRGEGESLAEARQLMDQQNMNPYLCAVCGGSGAVREVSGSNSGGFGSVNTYDVMCRQCWGLGFWHSRAKGELPQ